MQYAFATAAIIGAAAASWAPQGGSWGPPAGGPPSNGTWGDSYTTEVVTAYETYCPYATEITTGGVTYTATEATTLTITNCPGGCTVTKPLSSSVPPPVSTTPASPVTPTPYSSSIIVTTTPVAPVSPPVYPTGNGTVPAPPATGTGAYTSASGTSGSPIEQTDNGAVRPGAVGVGLLAALGLVAAL